MLFTIQRVLLLLLTCSSSTCPRLSCVPGTLKGQQRTRSTKNACAGDLAHYQSPWRRSSETRSLHDTQWGLCGICDVLNADLFIGGGGGAGFRALDGGGGGGAFLMLPTLPASMFVQLADRDPTLPYEVVGDSERSGAYRSEGLLASWSSSRNPSLATGRSFGLFGSMGVGSVVMRDILDGDLSRMVLPVVLERW